MPTANLETPRGPTAPPATAIARSASALFAFTVLASAINYASNLVFSRVLTPASYGDLTALLALTIIVAVPAGAAQIAVADRLAQFIAAGDGERVRWLIRYATGHVAAVAIAVGLIYAACIPIVYTVLDLQAPGPAIALVPLLILTFMLPFASGVLQGMERYYALGLMMCGVAAGRVVFGVPWAWAGGGSGGALAGQALAALCAIAAVGWLLRRWLSGTNTRAVTAGARRAPDARAVVASGAFIVFALMSNLDVLMAKIVLDPAESGEYAALATIGKMILFLPAAVAVVMVPNAARARQDGSAAHVLRLAGLLTAAACALIVIPAAIEPTLLMELMFGDDYTDAASGVLPMAIAAAGLAVLNLLVVYTVALQDRRWPLLLLVGVGLQIPGILIFGDSPAAIATVQAVVVFIVLVINELVFHPILRAERAARRA